MSGSRSRSDPLSAVSAGSEPDPRSAAKPEFLKGRCPDAAVDSGQF